MPWFCDWDLAPEKFKHIQTNYSCWSEISLEEQERLCGIASKKYFSGFPYFVEGGTTFYIVEQSILKHFAGDECFYYKCDIDFDPKC